MSILDIKKSKVFDPDGCFKDDGTYYPKTWMDSDEKKIFESKLSGQDNRKVQKNNKGISSHPTWRPITTNDGDVIWQKVKGHK